MQSRERHAGIVAGRLTTDALAENFTDLHEPLAEHEAQVAADRCYFCYDAPCMTACPTSIEIGRLQRFATDTLMAEDAHPYTRASATGKTIAVVGAGPAGLSAAHRLAMLGHDVTLFDSREKLGGLNEFGIASYKSTEDFAQKEVDWLLSIGGIQVQSGQKLGAEITLEGLKTDFDAVFLSIGLGGVNSLRADGVDLDGVEDAVDFIAKLRQSDDLSTLPVGRNVVVIGGGMTAVDAAVQAKLLGAQNVTMAYRRGKDRMGASEYEQDLAASKGVTILYDAQPSAVLGEGACSEVVFEYTAEVDGALQGTGEMVHVPADQVLVAIGQTLLGAPEGLTIEGGKIAVDAMGKTTVENVWAGGDCASGGDDLTVTGVAEGRDAAMDIHTVLMGEG